MAVATLLLALVTSGAAPATVAAEDAPRVAVEVMPLDPLPVVTAPAAADRSATSPAVVDGWSARHAPETAVAAPSTPIAAVPAATEFDDHETFERALGAIEAGKLVDGQHLLEQLVARVPASPLANDARRRLSEIYARAFAPPAPDVAAPAAPAVAAKSSADAATPSDKPAAWRDRARRTHRFEGMLGAEVGDRVFFGLASSDIGARARIVLERQARWIVRYPDLYVVVEGHSDEPGDEAQNRAISLDRAERARRMLIGAGLPAAKVDVDARGTLDRVASCDSSQCQAQNRRVVTRLMVVLPAGRERVTSSDEATTGAAPRLATEGGSVRPAPR